MDRDLVQHLTQTPDLSHRLRRLGFFQAHFRRNLDALAARCGLSVSVDPVQLTRAFLAWGEDFGAQRAAADFDRRDYIVFTAGLLVIRLLEAAPVSVRPAPSATGPGSDIAGAGGLRDIVAFWPEGFLHTEYCLTVLQAVLQQEFAETLTMAPAASDLRFWWSFRENVAEDMASGIGFFDLFVGSEPNWQFPTAARQRPAIRRITTSGLARGGDAARGGAIGGGAIGGGALH